MTIKVSKTEQKLLDGLTKYSTGATVTNPFSGRSVELSKEALALYDFVKGAEMLGTKDFSAALSLFRKLYPNEYMILLD